MKYLAHISEDKQREQSIKSHLEETALLAKEFAEEFGYGEWGYFCGLLHDIGKYSRGVSWEAARRRTMPRQERSCACG